jgi:hypothetical protein
LKYQNVPFSIKRNDFRIKRLLVSGFANIMNSR